METDTAGKLEAGVNITGVSKSGRENNSGLNEALKVKTRHSDLTRQTEERGGGG